jgi:hypothetical protein
MMAPSRQQGRTAQNLLRGVLRLASFDSDGLRYFTATPIAFLNSLAPLIAFPLVFSALILLAGDARVALTDLLATLVMLLAPPVLSEWLARFWRRDAAWLRYAVAYNWCQWIMPVVFVACGIGFGVLVSLGLPITVAQFVALLALLGYWLALHWFLARRGLGISVLRAMVVVGIVNIGPMLLIMPWALDVATNGPAR